MKRSTPPIEPQRLFVDTWGWLVLADGRDPEHVRAVAERRKRNGPGLLITTDYVLDETFTRLFSRCTHAVARQFCDGVLNAESSGLLGIERITSLRFQSAYRMRLRYRDKPTISFTDFTSFVVMQELGLVDALTADAHFAQVQLGFRRLP
jgi:predicted nucleic acid-binding protein